MLDWLRYVGGGRGPSLAGLWERVGDRFHGCRVRVTQENNQYEARITKVPPAMHYFGWNSGEAKWTSIRPLSPVLYTALDLYKIKPRNSPMAREIYREARIEFTTPDTLRVVCLAREDRAFPDQTWRRLTIPPLPPVPEEE